MYRTVFLYKIELNMYAKNKGERERRLIIWINMIKIAREGCLCISNLRSYKIFIQQKNQSINDC
jgi:hypothetical protein